MQYATQDTILPLPAQERPDYNRDNPVGAVMRAMESVSMAAGLEHYLVDTRQYLFSVDRLTMYAPPGTQPGDLTNAAHDVKEAFDKQNVAGIDFGHVQLVRGYAKAGNWVGPYLRVSYEPPADSPLVTSDGVAPGESILAYLKVNGVEAPTLVTLPYNWTTHRYEVEIWGFVGSDLRDLLDPDFGQPAVDRRELIALPQLIKGAYSDFAGKQYDAKREAAIRNGFSALDTAAEAKDSLMHPVRPVTVEIAFTNAAQSAWDNNRGNNYRLRFAMAFRGWRNYRGVGTSPNPHGGTGHLEFRNLWSNYFGHEASRRQELGQDTLTELGRDLEPWNYDADWLDLPPESRRSRDGRKPRPARESFMAVDYMDLHRLNPNCCIGIHRHRDNQEAFLLLRGKALMLVGDWCVMPDRDRAVEIRTMHGGDIALCKTGQMHALFNHLDEPIELFMFGGYD